jgi:hypothetical protein
MGVGVGFGYAISTGAPALDVSSVSSWSVLGACTLQVLVMEKQKSKLVQIPWLLLHEQKPHASINIWHE